MNEQGGRVASNIQEDSTTPQSAKPSKRIDVSLPHAWNYIRDIRKRVGEVFGESGSELRSASMMVASELIENAVKYGADVASAPNIRLSCCFDGDEMRIVVSNGSTDTEAVRTLHERVKQITDTPDKEALYIARLEELLADPTDSGKLGLYRIAFEGRFELSVAYVESVVTVTATRRCP
jgi:hypothetical protein